MKAGTLFSGVREFFTFAALIWGVASAIFFLLLIVLSASSGFTVTLDFNAAREVFLEMYVLIPLVVFIALMGLGFTISRGRWASR